MATTVEQVETALAEMGGKLQTELAALRGDVQTLTAELRLDREARVRADTAHDVVHTDHERRLRFLERAVWVAAGAGVIAGGGLGAILGG